MVDTQRWPEGPDGVAAAVHLLRQGGRVAFPTETVYGLGADARDGVAVAGIYEAKGRPSFNPLIAHVADAEAARREGVFAADALRLAAAFWPGPLTLVVPFQAYGTVSSLARAGLGTVALRVPAHPVAADLLQRFGGPVAAPSANRSGRVSPTTAAHVLADLDGRIEGVLDGGPTSIGLESTIVACLDGRVRLLRPGGVTRAAIEAVLGRTLDAGPPDGAAPTAPGMLASHYAPRARVRLNAVAADRTENVLDYGNQLGAAPGRIRVDLSPARDLREAAAALFGALHRLDGDGAARIAVASIPEDGLGEAINDRLRRAAAPRS